MLGLFEIVCWFIVFFALQGSEHKKNYGRSQSSKMKFENSSQLERLWVHQSNGKDNFFKYSKAEIIKVVS